MIFRYAVLIFLFADSMLASSRVLFVAGEPSHGPGEHEFPDGCVLLAEALNESGLGLSAAVSEGWPASIEGFDGLVLYSDGLEDHVANGHLPELRAHVAGGGSLVVLHFALEAAPGELAEFVLETIGGRFEKNWSVNPIWEMKDPLLGEHPVANGVTPFSFREELYYHLRLKESITPILRAVPPLSSLGDDGPRSGNPTIRRALEKKEPQVLAWVYEGAGVRTFGYTGGHFNHHWANDNVRRLVLNGIAWTVGATIPTRGITSFVSPIPQYTTIEEAIARGDLNDVKAHVTAFPERLHKGKHPKLSPLQQAILRKQGEIAIWLIEAGARPNQVDSSQRTLVHLAVDRGTPGLIAVLLQKGAEPNHLDKTGWTPLHHAAAGNKVEIARALLKNGADPMTLSEGGGTPLHEAAASGGAEMIALLLEHDVDPTIVSKTGVTALDLAREFKNEAAIQALEK